MRLFCKYTINCDNIQIVSQEKKVLIGLGIATLLIIVGGAFFVGGSTSPEKPTPPADAKILVRPDSNKEIVPHAKVTLVEFGDFQCPACGASYPIVTQILNDYKGKVSFVFRNYPLPMHSNAMIAAEAAEAAGAQGKYFDMYSLLYSNQSEWSDSKTPIDVFLKYAKTIGLDDEKFKADVQSKKFESKIKKDIADGDAVSVSATPTFFINGSKITGGLPYNEFKDKIDSALTSKKN